MVFDVVDFVELLDVLLLTDTRGVVWSAVAGLELVSQVLQFKSLTLKWMLAVMEWCAAHADGDSVRGFYALVYYLARAVTFFPTWLILIVSMTVVVRVYFAIGFIIVKILFLPPAPADPPPSNKDKDGKE